MMTPDVACPFCNQRMNNQPGLAGQVVQCPYCQGQFQMPDLPQPPPQRVQIMAPPAPVIQVVQAPPSVQYVQAPMAPLAMAPAAFTCPLCRSAGPFIPKQRVSTAGWVVMVVLLLTAVLFPFFWIGLLIKENYHVCGRCGYKLP